MRRPPASTWRWALPGTATTDFGAPDASGDWDGEPLNLAEAARLTRLLGGSWRAFDGAAAGAPATLRKGPRGGGRDRDGTVDHVREAKRSHGRKLGVRILRGTSWSEQRVALLGVLRGGQSQGSWMPRYAVRRLAWHVLDHAWEIEDRRSPDGPP